VLLGPTLADGSHPRGRAGRAAEPAGEAPCSQADGMAPTEIVTDGPVGAAVPPLGTGVTAWAIGMDGIHTLTLQRSLRGVLTITECGDDTARNGLRRGQRASLREKGLPPPPPACEDDAYNYPTTPFKWRDQWVWRFHSASTPDEIASNQDAEDALRNAMHNVTHAQTDCGLTDNVDAEASYQGHTVKSIDVVNANTGSPSCRSTPDGVSVVDFGQVGSGSYVFQCSYWVSHAGPNSATEADIRLNKSDWEWTVNPLDPSCVAALGVEPLATVGRGAGFGLGAVPESIHGNLTMSQTPNGACQDDESTLGLGDVLGLRSLY
jgi:hypothetical protein